MTESKETMASDITHPLIEQFQANCEKLLHEMAAYLHEVVSGKSIPQRQGKVADRVVAVFFEYQFDDFDMLFWLANPQGKPIKRVEPLPKAPNPYHGIDDADLEERLLTAGLKDEDVDDCIWAYHHELTTRFEAWFFRCWKTVAAAKEAIVPAYFSVHDTLYYTDLATFEEIRADEIDRKHSFGNQGLFVDAC